MESLQPNLQTHISDKVTNVSRHSNDDDDGELRRSSVKGSTASTVEEEVNNEERRSNASVCSVELDLELGMSNKALNFSQSEKDCRICHMSFDSTNQEFDVPIELGCSCKADLAIAHKHCAETWFKIKGNKICEVCGSIASNVVGTIETESEETRNEANSTMNQALRTTGSPLMEARSFWQSHRFLNFLLACMVFAFVISWLSHFNEERRRD